ncbi:hypothetical protein FDP41_013285 [Naegleria fowleri]|uniref:F-box domain-containing protein n=1 Tax=Naegleria fowleri TaxID=5763 RepID=A0A6A5C209_NAEFO|nr:uncharacterized protein FDP41_013285 [Naegleria fowleri]KAF0980802.1 hypothetical protein FDP41_013285 [Naegleria fowleri]
MTSESGYSRKVETSRNKKRQTLRKKYSKLLLILPDEILCVIASFLNAKSLLCFASCNSTLLALLFNQTPVKVNVLLSLPKIESILGTTRLMANSKLIKAYLEDESVPFSLAQRLVWRSLVLYYFPIFKQEAYGSKNIKNWMHLLRRRIEHLKLYNPSELPLTKDVENVNDWRKELSKSFIVDDIEGCEWIYKCPLNYSHLEMVSRNDDERFCSVCSRNVKRVKNDEEFKEMAMQGHCVAYSPVSEWPVLMGFAYIPNLNY